MKPLIAITSIFYVVLIIISCGKSTDPIENTDPVLSVGTVSHFHCELSWTQLNHQDHEFDSYHLYRSESPEIASDTSVAECVVSFYEIGQLQYSDSIPAAGQDYYYTLLTRMHESGRDQDTYLWSNEVTCQAKDIITVNLINNSGHTMHIMVHHAIETGTPWLSNIGTYSQWVASFDQNSCVTPVLSGDTLLFAYPEYNESVSAGTRIYIGDTAFDSIPDLNTYDHIYDKLETGWDAVWNTTCVDFTAIPLQMSANDTTVGFQSAVTRASLMAELNALPAPYSNLNYQDLRFFSPSHSPSTVSNQLDSAITLGLPMLDNTSFSYGGFNYSNVSFHPPDSLVTECSGNTVTIWGINTANVFACTIQPNALGTPAVQANLAGLIGAAGNRGVLHDPDKWDSSGEYYTANSGNAGHYNKYAKVLHSLSINGYCYAFPYDDFYGHSSSIHIHPGDSVTVTILPFN